MAGDDQTAVAALTLPLTREFADLRSGLRLQSLAWALLAGLGAGLLALPVGLESALRSAGCGFFYGLLAFHLQRVDPDDGHLQAGLVGAVCGIRTLSAPLDLPFSAALPAPADLAATLAPGLSSLMMALIRAWLPLWLPVAGAALLLQGAQRLLPALRP